MSLIVSEAEAAISSCDRKGNGQRNFVRGGSNRMIGIETDRLGTSRNKGWDLYFPSIDFKGSDVELCRYRIFYDILKRQNWEQCDWRYIEKRCYFPIDYEKLKVEVARVVEIFDEEMRDKPELNINCLGLAMHQLITEEISAELYSDRVYHELRSNDFFLSKIYPRLCNYGQLTPIRQLKASHFGKLVSVKGTVVKVSSVRPLCTLLDFKCTTCDTTQLIAQPNGTYSFPTKCSSEQCKGRHFSAERSSPNTVTVTWQTIKLQEIIEAKKDCGRTPSLIDCELTADLADISVPGEVVTVTGIVKCINVAEKSVGRGVASDQCKFILFIEANNVEFGSTAVESDDKKRGASNYVDFTTNDYYAIREIFGEPNVFKLLVASLCPVIYGHEMVKAGLLLAIFGGCQRDMRDGLRPGGENSVPMRSSIHVLVVGDPGLGKSQILKACCNVIPRGVFVCGKTSTTAGLTVSLSREVGSVDYSLEAGALVMGDDGCCCIDEFDKMSSQHSALLEAMEQQCVSIAKAGITCNLPVRTAILAAANPTGGHYDQSKTVSENLKMGAALLSRFDLVFILIDKPNENLDLCVSDHIMALHNNSTSSFRSMSNDSFLVQHKEETLSVLAHGTRVTLATRLKYEPKTECLDLIPHRLLRKYVAYARQHVKPKLTPEAAAVLKKFYLQLREQQMCSGCIPVTLRQLESLIRLTEARARLELREVATECDALDVIDIVTASMIDTFSDEQGTIHLERSTQGSGSSCGANAKKFVAALNLDSERRRKKTYSSDELKDVATSARLSTVNFADFIDTLNIHGYLLKIGPRSYKLQAASF